MKTETLVTLSDFFPASRVERYEIQDAFNLCGATDADLHDITVAEILRAADVLAGAISPAFSTSRVERYEMAVEHLVSLARDVATARGLQSVFSETLARFPRVAPFVF